MRDECFTLAIGRQKAIEFHCIDKKMQIHVCRRGKSQHIDDELSHQSITKGISMLLNIEQPVVTLDSCESKNALKHVKMTIDGHTQFAHHRLGTVAMAIAILRAIKNRRTIALKNA